MVKGSPTKTKAIGVYSNLARIRSTACFRISRLATVSSSNKTDAVAMNFDLP